MPPKVQADKKARKNTDFTPKNQVNAVILLVSASTLDDNSFHPRKSGRQIIDQVFDRFQTDM